MQRFSTFSVFEHFQKNASALNICEQVINLGVLTELLVQQSNLYSQQNRRYFLTYVQEMKALIAVNYIIAINQLSSIQCTGIAIVSKVTLAFKISLREQHTKKACKTFTLPTTKTIQSR